MNSFERRWEARWADRGDGPVQPVRLEESTELRHPPELVWALLTCVDDAPTLAPATVQRAFVVPGTPEGVGQQQCCIGPDGRMTLVEVTEADPPRRGAARHIAPPLPVALRSTYDVAPTACGSRVTLGVEVDLPSEAAHDVSWEQRCRQELRGVLQRLGSELDRRHPLPDPEPDELWRFDDAFVAAAPAREQSGATRLAAARRISAAHGRAQPWRAPSYGHEVQDRSNGWRSALVVLAVAAALLVGVSQLGGAGNGTTVIGDASARLPRPADAQDVRLLPPVAPPAGEGGFDLLDQYLDRPVGFDPCQPVHWVMREAGAPSDAGPLLSEAFTRLSEATGLVFVHDGATDEAYDEQRPLVQEERYGQRYVPVLVVWSSEAETAALVGDVGGFAGPIGLDPDGAGPRYVTGQMVLDTPQLVALPEGWPARLGVVLHELGHLVGLGHVADPTDTMHATTGPTTAYSLGALRGLAAVGSGPCFLD